MLDRDAILAADDLKLEEVEVPEWGGCVYVRTLPGAERDEFDQAIYDARGKGDAVDVRGVKVRLLVAALCDADGLPVFGPEDAEALNAKSSRVLDRLFDVAQTLNGLTADDVEELAKNSESDQSGASG